MNPADRLKMIAMTNLLWAARSEMNYSEGVRKGGSSGIAVGKDYEAIRYRFWNRMAQIANNELKRLAGSAEYRPNLCYRCGCCHGCHQKECVVEQVRNPGPPRYGVGSYD